MQDTEEPRGAGHGECWGLAQGLDGFKDRCRELLRMETQCRRNSAARVKYSYALSNRMFSATFSSSPDTLNTPGLGEG